MTKKDTKVDPAKDKITRDDIESSLRSLEAPIETKAQQAKSYVIAAVAAVGVAVMVGAFLFGKKRGTRASTVVEIRRI